MTLRAAVYARKSNEQNVPDEAKSVTRQVEGAKAFAEKQGWTVDAAHVYVDDGVSGGEFVDRHGLNALVAAAKQRPRPFDVLVTLELDRVGRDGARTVPKLQEVYETGVRIFFYQDGQEVHLRTPMEVFMLQAKAFAAADYREQVRRKTRDALFDKARKGHVAGGRVLGYKNVEIMNGDKRAYVKREVDPEQAEIVRRIFRMAADGKGLLRIAKTLNAEGVKNPTGQDRRDPAGRVTSVADKWAATGVRDVLHRDLYRGRVVYGKSRWVDRGGTKVKESVPETEWIVIEQDHLRIIPETLWRAAHARMERTHAKYLRRARTGQLCGKPEAGLESRYLLSGFLRCGVCGGNLIVSKKSGQRGKPQTAYICSVHRARPGACSAKYGVPAEELTTAVLGQLKGVFLNPAVLGKLLVDELETRKRTPGDLVQQQKDARRDIVVIDRDLDKLMTLLLRKDDVAPERVMAEMRRLESEKAVLVARLEELEGAVAVADEAFDLATWLDETRELFDNLAETLSADPAAGRQVLRRLLVGPISVTPRIEGTDLVFDFAGTSSFAGYAEFAGADLVIGAPPVRMESQDVSGRISRSSRRVNSRVRQVCPRGDSNTRHAV